MAEEQDWKIRVSEEARNDVPPEDLAHILTEMQTLLVTKGKKGLDELSTPVEPYPPDGLCPECEKPLANQQEVDPQEGFPDEFVCLTEDCKAGRVHFLHDDKLWRRLAEIDDDAGSGSPG